MGIAQRKVNINGFLQTKLQRNGKLNLVRMAVGVTASETSRDLQVIREVLNRLGVAFTERKILQVYGFPPNVPGIINTLLGALWCKAGVHAMYIGEQTALYIDATNLSRDIRILSQSTLQRERAHP